MAYEIHIVSEKDGKRLPIPLSTWIQAASSTENVRLISGDRTAFSPDGKSSLTLVTNEGDAEIFLDGEWLPAFRWSRRFGKATVAARSEQFDDPNSTLRTILRKLAVQCNGIVVGDEGEIYP